MYRSVHKHTHAHTHTCRCLLRHTEAARWLNEAEELKIKQENSGGSVGNTEGLLTQQRHGHTSEYLTRVINTLLFAKWTSVRRTGPRVILRSCAEGWGRVGGWQGQVPALHLDPAQSSHPSSHLSPPAAGKGPIHSTDAAL